MHVILTKGLDNLVRYLLPAGAPPTACTWALSDPQGNFHQAATALPLPTAYAASGADGERAQEALLTCTDTPTGLAVGEVVRIRDSWGRDHDALCWGRNAKQVRVADFGGTASEVASVWAPELVWTVPAALLDETGEGWRLDLVWTADGVVHRDSVYATVCLISLSLTISPREYLDLHPTAAANLAALEARRDWPRLVRTAAAVVEQRLRAMNRWYAAIISPTGLRQIVAAAVGVLLAPGSIPEGYKSTPDAWTDRLEETFTQALAEALANAHYDRSQTGLPAAADQEARLGFSYMEN
jgi:hypothetical protein